MADELARIDGVASVTTLLDVPLLESPPLSLTDLARADSMPTLRDPEVDRSLALRNSQRVPSIATCWSVIGVISLRFRSRCKRMEMLRHCSMSAKRCVIWSGLEVSTRGL